MYCIYIGLFWFVEPQFYGLSLITARYLEMNVKDKGDWSANPINDQIATWPPGPAKGLSLWWRDLLLAGVFVEGFGGALVFGGLGVVLADLIFEPGVLQDLSSRDSFGGIFVEDPLDEVLRSLRHSILGIFVLWKLVFSVLDLSIEVTLVLGEEGQLADHKDVEDDAAGPDVGRLPIVILFLGQVGAHVLGSTTLHRQLLLFAARRSKAKIYDLDVVALLLVDQDVVELQVPVDHVYLVHVGHRAHNLPEDTCGF